MGAPVGSNLCSGTTNGNTLATYASWTEREISFDNPVELATDTKYSIVNSAPSASHTNAMYWSAHRTSSYANGEPHVSGDSGVSWSPMTTTDDFWFTIVGGVEKETYIPATPGGYGLLSAWSFAQTFTATSSYDLEAIGLRLNVYSAPGGVSGGIYATTAGKPSGAALATFSFPILTETATWLYAKLSSTVSLTQSTVYAIVLDGEADEIIYWVGDATDDSDDYAGGAFYMNRNTGGGWVYWDAPFGNDNPENRDLGFKLYAKENKELYNGAHTLAYSVGLTNWRGQSFKTTTSYVILGVILKLSLASGKTPEEVTVGIRNTAADAPTKAKTPAPADAATDVTLDQATLTWEDGGGADTYNVYYGDTSGDLSLVSSAQAGTSFTVTGITLGSPYSYLTTRYWRIDSINAAGTTTGDEWSFTTIRLSPPTVTYWYSTTGQYYQLLIQSDGSYGDHPADGGVENTDFVYLAAEYVPNFIKTTRKLVAAANNKIWYEQ